MYNKESTTKESRVRATGPALPIWGKRSFPREFSASVITTVSPVNPMPSHTKAGNSRCLTAVQEVDKTEEVVTRLTEPICWISHTARGKYKT